MPQHDDINELLGVARNIHEGDYDVVDIDLKPESELYELAKYFSDALKKLKTVSGAIEDTYEEFPSFENILNEIIKESRDASENVLTCVDKINFNIDDIKENLNTLAADVQAGDFNKCGGIIDRLKDLGYSGQDVSFDIIASLEFQDISKQKIDKIIKIVYDLQNRLTNLVIKLGVKENKIDPEIIDRLKEKENILESQDIVDELLKEFGS